MFNANHSLGSWGKTFHNNYYNLSLQVAPIDESIDCIARAFSSGIPYMQKENGELTQDDDLVKFLLKPNNNQNFKEFSKEFVRNLYASGYSYLFPTSLNGANIRRLDKLKSETRPELFALNTDYISYKNAYLFGLINKRNKFDYNLNGTKITLDYNQVIPFWDKTQDPENYRIGISRIVALKDEITNIILANRAKTNKIKQSGKFLVTPSSRSLNNSIGNQMDQVINPENPTYKQRDLLEDTLESSGLSMDKSITVSKTELQVLNLMESIQDYSYDEETKEDKRTIKNAYSIPRELQNMGDDTAKYENRKQAYLDLFTLTILPLAINFTETIQNYYYKESKDKLILDYSHHPVFEIIEQKIEDKNKDQIDIILKLLDKDLITNEEAKQKLKANGII